MLRCLVLSSQPSSTPAKSSTRATEKGLNCCIPIDSHPTGKTKNTQTSTLIVYGHISVKVCSLDHYKEPECTTIIEKEFTPPLNDIEEGPVEKCSFPCCKSTQVHCPVKVFSVKLWSKHLWAFCSLECCLQKMATVSESHFSRIMKDKKNGT